MLFSGDELFAILKRHLPKEDNKKIANITDPILDTAKHWQEVEIHEKMHEKVETRFLHDICNQHAQNQKKKKIRLFYKHHDGEETE